MGNLAAIRRGSQLGTLTGVGDGAELGAAVARLSVNSGRENLPGL
jgi:hypothetical protein